MPFVIDSINAETISQGGNPIKPYKVYTALLTQSGTDTESTINSGSLTIGVTYTVNQNSPGMDFTNVGAPNNNLGTKFVATGTIPNSWGEGATYTLAYSEGAPVVTVLENTIGNIWFTYQGNGFYFINSNGLFTINKTWGFSVSVFAGTTGIIEPISIDISGAGGSEPPNTISIRLQGGDFGGDDLLNKTPIEIRVYN